jgi:hypothetical protein
VSTRAYQEGAAFVVADEVLLTCFDAICAWPIA